MWQSRRKQAPAPLDMATVAGDLSVPVQLAEQWPQIAATCRPYLQITAQAGKTALDAGKFGGYPCIPKDYAYPTDAQGEYLFPLAQFNFAQMPLLPGYPADGLLQFYVSPDTLLIDYDDVPPPATVKIIYFTPEQVREPLQDFSFLHDLMQDELRPVIAPQVLTFVRQDDYMGIGDHHTPGGAFDADEFCNQYLPQKEQLLEFIHEQFFKQGHKMGGYASFIDEDPRAWEPAMKGYVPLFQMVPQEGATPDDGVRQFFIHPDDLAARDFSRVVYHWDAW
ncbi:DUF1963 domain-containing protein [Chitinophaga horti]|uniref:DUF1963 domain-containing protein n=1 Tax=Chitinophaga horti TaxID=2920382 RepID=A0ABY6IUF6_9BACT|nr:DUF1963 domain-containing protein [Chitinophaga horti]UYQ90990.1 DUF1963 domain-containing protein [Chitinophaga horti]